MAQDFVSGYDAKIFVVKPGENYSCPFCLNVVNDPKQCPNGHTYCSGCIMTALDKRKECPICKVHLSAESLCRNIFMQGLIDEMKTVCISKFDDATSDEDHCNWTGIMSDRITHYEQNCEYRAVSCANNGCFETVQHKNIEKHANQCLFRTVKCKYCINDFQFYELDRHNQNCNCRPIPCSNNCSAEFSSGILVLEHITTECPLQRVDCPQHKLNGCFDCDGSILRNQLESHTTDPTRVLGIISNLSGKVNQLTSMNSNLITTVSALQTEIQSLIKLCQTQSAELLESRKFVDLEFDRNRVQLTLVKNELKDLRSDCESKFIKLEVNSNSANVEHEKAASSSTLLGEEQQHVDSILLTATDNEDNCLANSPPLPLAPAFIIQCTIIEYQNRKNKWVRGRVVCRSVEIPFSYEVENEFGVSQTVHVDKIRLLAGSVVKNIHEQCAKVVRQVAGPISGRLASYKVQQQCNSGEVIDLELDGWMTSFYDLNNNVIGSSADLVDFDRQQIWQGEQFVPPSSIVSNHQPPSTATNVVPFVRLSPNSTFAEARGYTLFDLRNESRGSVIEYQEANGRWSSATVAACVFGTTEYKVKDQSSVMLVDKKQIRPTVETRVIFGSKLAVVTKRVLNEASKSFTHTVKFDLSQTSKSGVPISHIEYFSTEDVLQAQSLMLEEKATEQRGNCVGSEIEFLSNSTWRCGIVVRRGTAPDCYILYMDDTCKLTKNVNKKDLRPGHGCRMRAGERLVTVLCHEEDRQGLPHTQALTSDSRYTVIFDDTKEERGVKIGDLVYLCAEDKL